MRFLFSVSYALIFSLFVISTLRFFEFVKKRSMMVFSLTGRRHDEFRIDEIRRDSRAMNQQNGNQRFLPNNVIGCYTYQQGLY